MKKNIIMIMITIIFFVLFISCDINNTEKKDTNNEIPVKDSISENSDTSKYIGTAVRFGKYYNRSENYAPLSWLVVDVTETKVYLMTAKIVDCVPFLTESPKKNESGDEYNYWTNSYIRQWLNNDFYNDVFSDDEKNIICLEELKILNYSRLDLDRAEEITEDHVFLMTAKQAEDIFASSELKAMVTNHAEKEGVFTDPKGSYGMWWLMSPGFYSYSAAYVDIYGNIKNGSIFNEAYDTKMTADYVGVRPMIAINYDDFVEIYDDIHVEIIN